jgi:catechol 2,3-dioxygenase
MKHTNKNKIIRPVLHHVGLTTGKFAEMVDWYTKTLGIEPTHESTSPTGEDLPNIQAFWATNDGANHRLAIIGIEGLNEDSNRHTHSRINHTAFEYETLDDLLDTYVRLKGLGIEPFVTADQGVSIAFYYEDPDGNTLELTMDTFGDWAKSTEFMRTSPVFAKRPMGQYVDVEKMLKAREEGATSEELHERAYAGEFVPDYPMDTSKMM